MIVYAKINGLKELLENADSKHAKKKSSPKQKTERNVTNKSAKGSTTREHKTKMLRIQCSQKENKNKCNPSR